jgi:predicted metal-dependent HD superfamily phosphohydrolase
VILSKEVEAAGPVMNAQRAENGLPPMQVYVLDDVGLEDKFSSTELRTQLQAQVHNKGDWIKRKWLDLCTHLGVPDESAWDWFSLIVRKYCRSYRGYHNLSHILELLEKSEGRLVNPQTTELAIWFHDVIYDTYDTSKNEELSAELLRQFLSTTHVVGHDQAVTYVLATKRHAPLTEDQDELEFLDLDMSILGAPPARYAEYRAGIRKEYYFYSPQVYSDNRKTFLQSCLGRTELFLLHHNQEAWGGQARTNLEEEILLLN